MKDNAESVSTSVRRFWLFACGALLLSGCSWAAAVKYPPSDQLYFTIGDATISEYKPLGYVCAHNVTLYSSAEAQAEKNMSQPLTNKVRELGGNGVINGEIRMWESWWWWVPPFAIKTSGSDVCGQAVRLQKQ